MRGIISFYEDGNLVGRNENLITSTGKNMILRFLAKMSLDYAGAIAVGLDSTLPTAADTRLGVQTGKVPVIVRSVDYNNQAIVFKGTLDPSWAGKIYEAGLLSSFSDTVSGNYVTSILTSFENYETWTMTTLGGVETTNLTDSRVGTGGKYSTISTNSGWIQYDLFKRFDLSGYSDTDLVTFGHVSYTTLTASLVVTFTDVSGATASLTQTAATHSAGSGNAQYNIYRPARSTFTLSSATFDWGNINKLTVRTNGTSGAGSSPFCIGLWDYVGLIDADALNPDYTLVTHTSSGSTTPMATKTVGKAMDIEYRLVFNL